MRITYVVSPSPDEYDTPYEAFSRVSHDPEDLYNADLIAFNGGEDVSPRYYGDTQHPSTHFNEDRDRFEHSVYNRALLLNIPMVGICRGAQFLNVMNGGKLIQNVNNHGISGVHTINTPKGIVDVTSTHHQMMWPIGNYELLGWASELSTVYETGNLDASEFATAFEEGGIIKEPDIVWWPNTKCLGVQYHPEYMPKDSEGYILFQDLIADLILK